MPDPIGQTITTTITTLFPSAGERPSTSVEVADPIDILPIDDEIPPEKPPTDFISKIASEAGLKRNLFWSSFDDPERFAFDANGRKGKTQFVACSPGNIFRFPKQDPKRFSIKDGVLRQGPGPGTYNLTLSSTWPTGGGNYEGFAIQGLEEKGWVVEARLRHEDRATPGFTAFWSMDLRHVYGTRHNDQPYEGHFWEPDFYEYWPEKNPSAGAGDPLYASHLHYRDARGGFDKKSDKKIARQSVSTIKPSDHDPTKWFVITHRVLPIGGGSVRVEWFKDWQRVAIKEVPWAKYIEGGHFPIFIGGAPWSEWDYVGVWA